MKSDTKSISNIVKKLSEPDSNLLLKKKSQPRKKLSPEQSRRGRDK
jgi:hypothetical protein